MSTILFEELQQIVPARYSNFKKLVDESSAPYVFLRYGVDLSDQYCLYYRSQTSTSDTVQTQRLFLDEIEQLLDSARKHKLEMVDQKTFRKYCPRSSKHPTAYTVAVRLLEHMGKGRHVGRGLMLFSVF